MWYIASFRFDAEFGRYRGETDIIRQAKPAELVEKCNATVVQ
jgi:hypothetical protein